MQTSRLCHCRGPGPHLVRRHVEGEVRREVLVVVGARQLLRDLQVVVHVATVGLKGGVGSERAVAGGASHAPCPMCLRPEGQLPEKPQTTAF